MSKVNLLLANLLILICVFWLNPSGLAVGPCPPDCPGPTSTIPSDVGCNPNWLIKWDPNNPHTVSPGGNVTLKFGEGNRPYNVTVTGNDFWLDQGHTVTTINNNYNGTITLYAGNNSCGSAEIKITDRCSNEETGYVRSPSGKWGSWSDPKILTICIAYKWGNTTGPEICEDAAFKYQGSYGGGW